MSDRPAPLGAVAHSRTAHGAASRERLLEAAVELFAERGYAATSVESICHRAGAVKTGGLGAPRFHRSRRPARVAAGA